MRYTAKISRNLRYLSPGQPTVLLRGIQSETEDFRDHAWVALNNALDTALKSNKYFGKNKSAIIEFEAEPKQYKYRDSVKITLDNISNVRIIGRA